MKIVYEKWNISIMADKWIHFFDICKIYHRITNLHILINDMVKVIFCNDLTFHFFLFFFWIFFWIRFLFIKASFVPFGRIIFITGIFQTMSSAGFGCQESKKNFYLRWLALPHCANFFGYYT